METKGIIISKEDYERLEELEKNFDNKVKENKESFKKGLEDAIKGNLVKVLWVNDKYCADMMGCDLSDEGIDKFIRREDADFVDSVSTNESYDRNKLVKEQTIVTAKRTIRKLWWAFGIMFVAWLVQLTLYIVK